VPVVADGPGTAAENTPFPNKFSFSPLHKSSRMMHPNREIERNRPIIRASGRPFLGAAVARRWSAVRRFQLLFSVCCGDSSCSSRSNLACDRMSRKPGEAKDAASYACFNRDRPNESETEVSSNAHSSCCPNSDFILSRTHPTLVAQKWRKDLGCFSTV